MSTLTDFLKEFAAEYQAKAPERKRTCDEWVQAVERLLQRIEGWLREADTDKVLRIERKTVEIAEAKLGHYPAPALVITLGNRRVEVAPLARFVLGPRREDAPLNTRARGMARITDGLSCFDLYRYTHDSGEHWVYIDTDEYLHNTFDREAFERMLVIMLR